MSSIITCTVCDTRVGELASGSKIKKGTRFLCSTCNYRRMSDPQSDVSSLFGKLFKGGKR